MTFEGRNGTKYLVEFRHQRFSRKRLQAVSTCVILGTDRRGANFTAIGTSICVAGKVTPEMMHEWVAREGVELRGAGVDESPHVYKRLPEVLAEHAGSIRVLHTLQPLGVAMAGAKEFDPYKD